MEPNNLLVGKKCRCCKRELEISIEFFGINSNSKDGYRTICRNCEKAKYEERKKPEVKGIEWPELYITHPRRYADNYVCFEEWPLAKTYHRRKRPRKR